MATETVSPAATGQAPATTAPATALASETKLATGTDGAKGVSGERTAPAATPDATKPAEPKSDGSLLGKRLPPAEQAKDGAKTPDGEQKPTAEKYEVALPKDALLGADLAKGMSEKYQELGLNKDQAQKLAEHTDGVVKGYVSSKVAELDAKEAGWWKDIENHPKYGGANLENSNKFATAALDKFFPGLKNDLVNSPYAVHPVLFSGLVELGKMTADPSFRLNGQQLPAAEELTPAQRIYGKDGKGKNIAEKPTA